MRLALFAFAAMMLSGCGDSPTAPGPSVFASLHLSVLDERGNCIEGATIEVVRGQLAGQSFTQRATCWDGWGGVGIALERLTPDQEMTFRASALGYEVLEKTVVPTLGEDIQAVFFEPARTRK